MGKIVNFILLIASGMLFSNTSSAEEVSPDTRYAREVCSAFIKEMEKKHGWTPSGTGSSMPYDIEELTVYFTIHQKSSVELSRRLLIPAIERFREMLHSHEKILPYLRNVPLDITAARVVLYFEDKYGRKNFDGVAYVTSDYKGDITYDGAKENERSTFDYYEIHRESYDEACKKLGIEGPSHVSLIYKTREARKKQTKEDAEEAKRITKLLAEKEEAALLHYGPGDELKILGLSGSCCCCSVVEALRERIVGGAERYFDEAFLETIAEKEKQSSSGEYIEYWPNGELKVKLQWKNGKPDGHMHGWYPNAVDAFKAYFKEGVKQGVHLSFLPLEWRVTSEAFSRCFYYNEEGKLHGRQDIIYPGGFLKGFVSYRNGILDGPAMLCNTKGKSERRWEYKKGKLQQESPKI